LTKIGNKYPDARQACIIELNKQLELYQENAYEFNASLIGALTDLKAIESIDLIKQAFDADRVDEFGVDWDDVQVAFGLKEPEPLEINPNFGDFLFRDPPTRKIQPEDIQIIPATLPAKAQHTPKSQAQKKEKVKNKMIKQSRKKNRRRK